MTMHMNEVAFLRARVDELEEELRQMRDIIMPFDNPFLGRFGLSPQQAAIINALYKNNGELPAKRLDQLMIEFARETRSEHLPHAYGRARVAVSHTRKKLNRYGIVINHHNGFGYKLTKESKDKLKKMLEKKDA